MKIAIYYRVSTDAQDFASQKHAVEKYLSELPSSKKPSSVRVFEDKVTGKKEGSKDRPGFQALLRAVTSGDIDTVVVYRLDRISRHAMTAMTILMDWVKADVGFVSVTQPIFNLTQDNPLRLTILAMFSELAQLEREAIVTRVKAGLQAAKARGVQLGAKRKIYPRHERKARVLREDGLSYRQIADKMNIHHSTVIKMLKGQDILIRKQVATNA